MGLSYQYRSSKKTVYCPREDLGFLILNFNFFNYFIVRTSLANPFGCNNTRSIKKS